MTKQISWHNNFDIIEELGEGGNAKVYLVKEKSTGCEFALKELYNKNNEKKCRFINEIRIIKKCESIVSGIIPIIDSNEEEYWYTMPKAIKILDYVRDRTISDIVLGGIQLSETLEKLHEKEIFHRDIKPSNIYFYEDRYSFGDFGLVDFPDNPNEFTRSDRGLGAIFTIAPEMKRDPKHADGKKADVFSLAKTMWMLLSGDDRGFDGVYNYLDASHSLRYIEKYRNTHLIELEELLKDATENDPNLRPNINEFKERLTEWIEIYSDYNKSQASEWKFLTKQLFGLTPPESSTWRDINKIVEILNIVAITPAYNHMLLPDGGGLDFCYAELATEDGCIYLYDTIGLCFIVKPKRLCYEVFDKNYKWNYFLLEIDNLCPIFKKNDTLSYEVLVEDTPAHYVDAMYETYGVYNYDTGEPLPDRYKTVRRYLNGKFLIVMKNGPYNGIPSSYDGRHGLCSNSDFRKYIEDLVKLYSHIYNKAKQNEISSNINNNELEKCILKSSAFRSNPFKSNTHFTSSQIDIKNKIIESEKSKSYIEENYQSWNLKKLFEVDNITSAKVKFCFKFTTPNHNKLLDFFEKPSKYICKDGYIKELESPLDDCFCIYDRLKAINLRNNFQRFINNILCQNGLCPLDEYENCISVELIKCGSPSHLFTKQEMREEMKKADDRINNQLIIDENGYAKVIKDEGYGYLYPVRHESWDAGNVYVGKYSKLSTLDGDYISSLQGWLLYLETEVPQYIDYYDNQNEEELLNKISQYY